MRSWMVVLLVACSGGRDDRNGDGDGYGSTIAGVYRECAVADDCSEYGYDTPVCLEKSGQGYCTGECTSDDVCAEQTDADGWDLVCASFENEAAQYCFPSCRDVADTADPETECPAGFTCRSTGGGANNRKVCFPEGAGTTSGTTPAY